jgi:hypothetical protein
VRIDSIRVYDLSGPTRRRSLCRVRPQSATETDAEAVSSILALMRSEREALALGVLDVLFTEVPAYAGLPQEELLEQLTRHVQLIFDANAAVSERGRSLVEEAGASRARHGVPIEDVLRGWQVGLRFLIGRAQQLAMDRRMPSQVGATLVQETLRQADTLTTAMAVGHRRAELERLAVEQDRRTQLVRSLIQGSGASSDIRALLRAMGIDPERAYGAICAPLGQSGEPARVLGWLERCSSHGALYGLAAVVDGDLVGFTSPVPLAPIDCPVGVGPLVALEDLPASYRLAARAAKTSAAIGRNGPTRLEDLGVLPAILADADVGRALEERYLEPALQVSSGEALLKTVAAYLAESMRVDAAAERLFLHPNTVRYRLRRYAALTGADLTELATLAELHWSLQRAAVAPRPLQGNGE